jgi:hypothetical protein
MNKPRTGWRTALAALCAMGALYSHLYAQAAAIPDTTAFSYYECLFRHVTVLKARADEKVAKGQAQTKLRQTYQSAAGLTDQEAAALENTALKCSTVLDQIFGQAHQVLPSASANPAATRSALKGLQQQRVAAVLAFRDTLHQQFGDQRFSQFETFLRSWMTTKHPGVQPVKPTSNGATVPSHNPYYGGRR